jgi:hypothetical protein
MTTESGRNGVWRSIAPLLGKYGVPMRIENAIASGMPDSIFAARVNLIYIELKVVKHKHIELRPFQNAYASRCIPHLNPQFFWFLCYDGEHKMYMFTTLRPHIEKAPGRHIVVNMSNLKPDHIITNNKSVELWLNKIKNYIPL